VVLPRPLSHAFVHQHLPNVMSNNLTKRDIVLKIFTDKG
jgi:hypothetical protein